MDYNQYRIVPQYSEIKSRAQVNTQLSVNGFFKTIPVLPANMEMCEKDMCIATYMAGVYGAMHRFMTIEENVKQYTEVRNNYANCFVSLGVNGDSRERFQELYKNYARLFIIDIAHGHSVQMKEMVNFIKKNSFEDVFVVGGNIGDKEAVYDLYNWGCDAVKIGIAGGKVCSTYNVTGVMGASVELLKQCNQIRRKKFHNKYIIADGGVREIGDICKALAAGADLVMSGFLFSKCKESAIAGTYRGMASSEAMKKVKDQDGYMPTAEGISMNVETNKFVSELIKEIDGGLRSSFTYSNALNLKQFQEKAILKRIYEY